MYRDSHLSCTNLEPSLCSKIMKASRAFLFKASNLSTIAWSFIPSCHCVRCQFSTLATLYNSCVRHPKSPMRSHASTCFSQMPRNDAAYTFCNCGFHAADRRQKVLQEGWRVRSPSQSRHRVARRALSADFVDVTMHEQEFHECEDQAPDASAAAISIETALTRVRAHNGTACSRQFLVLWPC